MKDYISDKQQYDNVNDPDPKLKTDKDNEAILNKQDDNSYEEPVTDNTPKTSANESSKPIADKNFEYKNEGEFESDLNLTDTNPADDFL